MSNWAMWSSGWASCFPTFPGRCTGSTCSGTSSRSRCRSGHLPRGRSRRPPARAVIEEHRHRTATSGAAAGLTDEIATLRTALDALADKVRWHDEQLRRLPAGRDFSATSPGDTAAMSSTRSLAGWAWPIVHAGQTVGRLEVVPIKTQLELLDSFADQAGLAFHNAWLQAELAARAEAIEAEPRAGRVAAPGW